MTTRVLIGMVLLSALIVSPSYAWKLETHYWLAKEVVKELGATNGSVSIPSKSSYSIPPGLYQAIKDKPGDYLIGVLGPDTYPDMVAGQMTTHPGLEATPRDPKDILPLAKNVLAMTGRHLQGPLWGTDDWLQWVRSRAMLPLAPGVSPMTRQRELAFAYGYLTHAAMDMWAHSYVNLYSGDVFSLMDEQEVEFRHMAIETFVKRTHQGIFAAPIELTQEQAVVQLRNKLRNPLSVTTPSTDELSRLTAPIDFVRSTLILNSQVANQYARELSTLHLFAMYVYWAEVGEIRSRVQPLRTLVNTAALDADRKVRDAEAAFDAADRALRLTGQAYSTAYDLFNQAERVVTDAAAALDRAIRDTRRTFNLGDDINNWPPPAKAAIQLAQNAMRAANNALTSARNEYNRQKDKRDRLQADQERALRNADTEKAARIAIRQVRDQSLNVIDGGVTTWQEGIEDSVDAYILAWEDTSKELMRPPGRRLSPGGDITEPLKEWVTCWGPTFGLPVLTQIAPVCQKARSSYLTASDQIKQLLQNALIPRPVKDALEELDRLANRAVQQIVPEAAKMVSATIRIDNGAIAGYARSIVNLRMKEPTSPEIDAEFADDISGKHLATFPTRFTDLLYQDMGFSPLNDGQLHVDKSLADLRSFAALQNAFTMAKLVLLDGGDLNRLTLTPATGFRELRMARTASPPPLKPYDIQAPAGEILIGAVRSIDGDHQWQKLAPLLPRRTPINCSAKQPCAPRIFGYDGTEPGKSGLRFWRDPELRQSVFNKIFQGPLTPGLVSALGPQNLARGIGICPTDPFPPSNGFDGCRDARLVPNLPVAPKSMQLLNPPGQTLPPAGMQKPFSR